MTASPPASAPARPAVGAGIALMLLTMVLFVSADTTAKYLTGSYSAVQVTWARFIFSLPLLLVLTRARLGDALKSRRIDLQLARSGLQFMSSLLFFCSVALLPLATAITVGFAQPLLVTVLSVPLLGEKVGPRRWAAVMVGFIGVLVIVRPGLDMNVALLLPLATAVSSALYQLATRRVAVIDRTTTSLLYTVLVGTLLATLAAPFFWQAPDMTGWVLMAMLGTLAGLGHFCIIEAYSRAPASLLAPFTYTQLVWATLSGFIVFGDLPDHWTIVGALIIVASGLYVLYREAVRRAG